MDSQAFDDLLILVENRITKQDTVMRWSITAEQRLIATLRCLATGRSYEDLKCSTGISAPSLSKIIPETCQALYQVQWTEFLKVKVIPEYQGRVEKIAEGFCNRWDFVNCGGAMDGKHIRIVPPPDSGAFYYNYKNYYSTVLMALVDSNYEFIFVDVSKNGRISDGGILEQTEFMRRLNNNQLNLPKNNETVNNLNFAF
ncbi:uncharacterized protein LOC143374889 [Andrena cerasifolii]|uniref:uncharacterized protein LOC143374889 n=1 Tax=Andrena cerasifolii TaxID=2819439 RepID=UPI0040378BF4